MSTPSIVNKNAVNNETIAREAVREFENVEVVRGKDWRKILRKIILAAIYKATEPLREAYDKVVKDLGYHVERLKEETGLRHKLQARVAQPHPFNVAVCYCGQEVSKDNQSHDIHVTPAQSQEWGDKERL